MKCIGRLRPIGTDKMLIFWYSFLKVTPSVIPTSSNLLVLFDTITIDLFGGKTRIVVHVIHTSASLEKWNINRDNRYILLDKSQQFKLDERQPQEFPIIDEKQSRMQVSFLKCFRLITLLNHNLQNAEKKSY